MAAVGRADDGVDFLFVSSTSLFEFSNQIPESLLAHHWIDDLFNYSLWLFQAGKRQIIEDVMLACYPL